MKVIISICVLWLFSMNLVSASEQKKYLDPKLPTAERVADLIGRMTLEEKVNQMVHASPALERLGVPKYNWWNEALHGVARAGFATVFPQAIGMGATWNDELIYEMADVISTEARAKYHDFVSRNQRGIYQGLTYWSPNINIFRDPRWGRGQETYGEDPYLTARIGVAFVKGLQGDNDKYFKLIATPKHYAVHSGPEPDRHHFDAVTNKRDLYETYLPAFEATIKEAEAYSIMCAYNRYLGQAACAQDQLLKEILRDDWGFAGYVVSDCGAVRDIHMYHLLVETPPEAAALALKAGTDLNCGVVYKDLVAAVDKGLVTEADIDKSLTRLFTARFKLGMFDPDEIVPYAQIPITENDTAENRALSVRVAQESIVLLKNAKQALPLSKKLKKIAVFGPTADSWDALVGNYHGTPSKSVTILQGIRNKVGAQTEVTYKQGSNLHRAGPIYDVIHSQYFSYNGASGLKADYFKNTELKGEPFVSRVDRFIDSNWIKSATIPGFGPNNISVRWSGNLNPPVSGEYVLALTGDDGYRLYLDGKLLIEDWTVHAAKTIEKTVKLTGGKSYPIRVEYFQGRGGASVDLAWKMPNTNFKQQILQTAKSADAVIFVGGITARLEGEELKNVNAEGFHIGDRIKIHLPKPQQELLKTLHEAGKPLIVVLTSGSALAVNWSNRNADAIVQAWYPGQEGGTAVADVLFGDYNPAGRLPVTFYKSVDQLPTFTDYNMEGKTYRFFSKEPLFPFGYGLSYSTFAYSKLSVAKKAKVGDAIKVKVRVTNTGKVAGDEVVQLYVKDSEASAPVPVRSLQAFTRVHLRAGESKTIRFDLEPKQFSMIDYGYRRVIEPGEFTISVGGGLPDNHAASTEVLEAKLTLEGKSKFLPL